MLKRSSLIFFFVLAGLGATSAQQARHPELVTDRSVAIQPAPTASARSDVARRDWAAQAIARFLDDGIPHSKPAD